MNNSEQAGDLANFNWESSPEQLDFFGIKNEEYQEQVEQDKSQTKKEPVDEESAEEPEKTEEKSPVFESFSDETSTEEPTEDKQKKGPGRPAKVTNDYLEQFNSFRDAGIIKHFELEDDIEDLDEDSFKEILEQDYEEEINLRLEQWATQELDEEAQAFIKFKKNGGKTSDFFNTIKSEVGLNGDIEDERFQNKIIRDQLRSEDWDEDEIEDRIKYLTETDKKGNIARKYFEKLKKASEEKSQKLVAQQEKAKQQAQAQKAEFDATVKETLNTLQDVKGLKITAKDKINLYKYITKADEEVGGRKVTGLQRAFTEAIQDPEKLILISKLLYSDFDLSDIEKKIKTTENKKIKETLESRKGLRPSSTRGSDLGGKSLADLWN